MGISGQGECGAIRLFNDFCGPEIPVANAVAYGTTAGGCNYSLGDFVVKGDLAETDTGIAGLDKSSGFVRISGNDENGKGVWIGSDVAFSPQLNGQLVCEARVESAALTARVLFVGFMATCADDVAEPITSTTATCTRVCNAIGFLFDSQLTVQAVSGTEYWSMPYMISTTSTQNSTDIDSDQALVAGECDVLRVVINPDGSAEWWINGELEQTVAAAAGADVATLLAGGIGCWATTSTAANLDVDYLLVKANRDWTR